MKVNMMAKENIVSFEPEGEMDIYELGQVFGQMPLPHSVIWTCNTDNPVKKLKRVSVKPYEIWSELKKRYIASYTEIKDC